MVTYWLAFLQPRLKVESEAGIRAIAQSQTQALEDLLSLVEDKISQSRLSHALDKILLLTDPESKSPFIKAVSLTMDYDVVNIKSGTLDLVRGDPECENCFITEIPLYSKKTRELIGLAQFHCSSEFFQNFKTSVRLRFFTASGVVLILLFVAWWIVAHLLRPLRLLSSSLQDRDIDIPQPLPALPGHKSAEIEMVKNSLDTLLRKIGERAEEREALIEELRHLQSLLGNVINSMPSILVGVDPGGNVTQWNNEAKKVTGMSFEDAKGRNFADVFPKLSGKMENVRQAILKKEVQKDLKIYSEIEGTTHFSDVTVYPLVTNGVEGAVIRIDDVTERVRIEEMMIQSEKMLSVGGLAAGMAHEINNPLAGIMQNVQVMRNRMSGTLKKNREVAFECGTTIEKIEEYMEKRSMFSMIDAVMESGRRAAKIVDNMLSFSRKSDARFAKHDICELLDKTVALAENDYDLKKKYDFRQIEIIRNYVSETPPVLCEHSKIQQVILNILKNGAQAMMDGRGQVTDNDKSSVPRFTLSVIPEKDMACIEIEDNGPGMDEATLKRVFEPFFTTKAVGVGTGLGLSVSYFIITENHRGTLDVESTPGNGAKFIIRLPLERKNNEAISKQ